MKILIFVICLETIICLFLYIAHDCTSMLFILGEKYACHHLIFDVSLVTFQGDIKTPGFSFIKYCHCLEKDCFLKPVTSKTFLLQRFLVLKYIKNILSWDCWKIIFMFYWPVLWRFLLFLLVSFYYIGNLSWLKVGKKLTLT